jgi:hypothetical protein
LYLILEAILGVIVLANGKLRPIELTINFLLAAVFPPSLGQLDRPSRRRLAVPCGQQRRSDSLLRADGRAVPASVMERFTR